MRRILLKNNVEYSELRSRDPDSSAQLGWDWWSRVGVLQRMLMRTNVSMALLEIQHPLSTGLPVYSRPRKVGTVQKIDLAGVCF